MRNAQGNTAFNCLEQFSDLVGTMSREVLSRTVTGPGGLFDAGQMIERLTQGVKVDSAQLMREQMACMEKQMELWQGVAKAMLGEAEVPVVCDDQQDERFKDDDWSNNAVFSYLKQAYLLNARMLQRSVEILEFDDPKAKDQVRFYTRQYINSLSPSNFLWSNPEVCRETMASQGRNLMKGMENLLRDLEQSPPEAFKIRQTDSSAFELGENLAVTPGKVVYQNDLMQLIQYSPSRAKVHETPLLIIPPFINKYYILDLDEKKSLVRWLVDQGFTLFMVSWVNPDASLEYKSFTHYMKEGPIAALDVVEAITGQREINMVGYCVGGTLLAATQAYLLQKGDKRIKSLTFFTTLLDFSQPGEVGNYVSPQLFPMLEQSARTKGVFDGRIIGCSFSLLRENSLFWSYYVNNYLKGREPAAFDILHWNNDSTNVPAEVFCEYVRNTYLENRLVQPGAVQLDGVPIDLGTIDTPAYFLATEVDHIVLWRASYSGAGALSGPTRFVLAGSGHVAGVVNPPAKNKYGYWTNDNLVPDANAWLEEATRHPGSWWTDWAGWLAQRSGAKVSAKRRQGNAEYPPLEDAPGSYVRVRI